MKGGLDARHRLASHADAIEAGGNDLGIVDDEHIAGAQDVGNVAHAPVEQGTLRVHDKQARGIARLRRAQRDPVLW